MREHSSEGSNQLCSLHTDPDTLADPHWHCGVEHPFLSSRVKTKAKCLKTVQINRVVRVLQLSIRPIGFDAKTVNITQFPSLQLQPKDKGQE